MSERKKSGQKKIRPEEGESSSRRVNPASGRSSGESSRSSGSDQPPKKSIKKQEAPFQSPEPSTSRTRGGYRTDVELRTIPVGCKTLKATPGPSDKTVEVWSNFVQLSSMKDRLIYQYRVDFEPNIESVKLRGGLFHQATANTFSSIVNFDGESDACSGHKTSEVVTTAVLDHPTEPGNRITITIKRVGTILWGSFEMIRLYNMNMKKLLKKLGFFQVSRAGAYVHETLRQDISNSPITIIGGFRTAANVHERGSILMNFEPVHKLIQKSTVYDIMNQIRQRRPSSLQEEIKTKLTGKLVVTNHNKKIYKIEDVDFGKQPTSKFQNDKAGREMTFLEYYQNQHNLTIRDHGQPLLLVVDNNRRRAEETGTIIYLVPEHCNIAGLTDEQRDDFRLKIDLVRASQIAPKDRVESLKKFLEELHKNQEVSETLNKWGYSYAKEPIKITRARVLGMEKVGLAGCKAVGKTPRDWTRIDAVTASFDRVVQNEKIALVPKFSKMCLIIPRSEQQRLENIERVLKSGFQRAGLEWRMNNVTLPGDNAHNYSQALKALPNDITAAVVVLPKQDKQKYDTIKKLASCERGLITQVVTSKLLVGDSRRRPTPADESKASGAAVKIAIQVAAKIGGEPWYIDIPTEKLMICGYDTHHDTTSRASFGAFVAAMNDQCSRWYSKADKHDRLEELSSHLAENLGSALKQYQKVNKRFPQRVYMYRDGVGDGQLANVFEVEVKQIQKAIHDCDKNIKLTFVVVNKRIGARFYMKAANTSSNPTPGTVIDDVVTRQERYDFYLISQHTRNGTVAPTYYNILHDESGLTPGQHQTLAFKLCFLYYNWSGTVKVPAPCQYAHKLAYLCGEHLHQQPNATLDDRLHFL